MRLFSTLASLLGMIEGQGTKGTGTWRTYLYDYQTGNADTMHIATNGGSKAFANPTLLSATLTASALVVTLFVPEQSARKQVLS